MSVYDKNGNLIANKSSGSSGTEYFDPDVITVTLSPSVTLENTRISGGQTSTVQGTTTYLFDYSAMETLGYSALVSVFTSGVAYGGVYTYENGTYTYTNSATYTPYHPVVLSDYDGFFVSTTTLTSSDFQYYCAIPVATNAGFEHSYKKGFRTIAQENIEMIGVPSNGYIRFGGVPNDNAYIMDTGAINPIGTYSVGASTAIANSYKSQLTSITYQFMFSNIAKAPTYFEVRPYQVIDSLRALCKRGVYLWELTNPEEVTDARHKIPKITLVHAGNFMDQMIWAMAQGWHGCECDVRTTSDGEYILSHDAALGGLTIAESTYDALIAVRPNIMTLSELMKLIKRYDGWLDMHWQAVDDADKLTHIQDAYGYGIRFVMYYSGSGGTYIGDSIAIKDFWKTGLAYTNGLATHDTTHANIKFDIGNGLNWKDTEQQDGALTYTSLTDGTYDPYNFMIAYIRGLDCLYQAE